MISLTGLTTDRFSRGVGQGISTTNAGAQVVLTGTVDVGGSNKNVKVTIQVDSLAVLDELNVFGSSEKFSLTVDEEV